LLRSAKYRAEAFGSAAGFLESLSVQVPDCLILDLQMPAMTGLELQDRLRQRGSTLPVIVITAHDEPGTRSRCLAMGASRYFRKPVEGDELLDAVRSLVGPSVAGR
jgi:FixJ family two-component response regulator